MTAAQRYSHKWPLSLGVPECCSLLSISLIRYKIAQSSLGHAGSRFLETLNESRQFQQVQEAKTAGEQIEKVWHLVPRDLYWGQHRAQFHLNEVQETQVGDFVKGRLSPKCKMFSRCLPSRKKCAFFNTKGVSTIRPLFKYFFFKRIFSLLFPTSIFQLSLLYTIRTSFHWLCSLDILKEPKTTQKIPEWMEFIWIIAGTPYLLYNSLLIIYTYTKKIPCAEWDSWEMQTILLMRSVVLFFKYDFKYENSD